MDEAYQSKRSMGRERDLAINEAEGVDASMLPAARISRFCGENMGLDGGGIDFAMAVQSRAKLDSV